MRRLLGWVVAGGIGALAGSALTRRPAHRGRSRRHEHFLTQQGGSILGISTDLLHASHHLLRAALEERRGGVWRSADNHATMYAPGVAVMIATSLDAWLSELIAFGRTSLGLREEDVARVIDIGTVAEKYGHTATLLFQQDIRPSTDLEYVSKVRNEIIYFLPYTQNVAKQTVPGWLQYLEQQDLLITAKKGKGSVDFHFSQKLGSYRLAYWACETVYAAVQALEAHAQQTKNVMAHIIRADNFCVMASIHSPEELPKYDADHGLTLTN